jgi:hypothetical protein
MASLATLTVKSSSYVEQVPARNGYGRIDIERDHKEKREMNERGVYNYFTKLFLFC